MKTQQLEARPLPQPHAVRPTLPPLEPISKKRPLVDEDFGLIPLRPRQPKPVPGPLKPPHKCGLTILKSGAEPLPPKGEDYRPAAGELFGAAGPRAEDVRQGGIGDCWLLAPLAALCEKQPHRITEMIRERQDGRVDVRFYREVRGRFVEAWITVSRDLPAHPQHGRQTAAANDRDHDGKPELWVPIIEKAFARFAERFIDERPGYRALQAGDPTQALEAITGEKSRWLSSVRDGADALWERMQNANIGRVVLAASSGAPASSSIVRDHAYAVREVFEKDGERYVSLRNPWGGPAGPDGAFVVPFSAFVLSFDQVFAVEKNPSVTLTF